MQLKKIQNRLTGKKDFMKKISTLTLLLVLKLTVFSQNTFIMQLDKHLNSSNILVIPSQNNEISVWISDSLELHKFDKCGNSLWNKKFDFPDFISPIFENMIPLKNGGYAFMTRETTGQIVSSRITKLDNLGNVIWSKVYSIPSYSISSYSLIEDDFGDLFIYGNTSPLGGGTPYNLIVKINANGDRLWSKHYNHGGIWGQAITTSDNGILFRTGSRLIKLNNLGNVQWTSQNWASGFYHYYAPIEVSDGYIFTASITPTGFINFMKIDKAGNQVWGGGKMLNFEGVNRKLLKKVNGNIVSIFNKTINGKNLPTIIEFDKDLNVVTTNSIQFSQPDIELTAYDINFVNNETPILVGIIDSLGHNKPFIAKLNPNYQSECEDTTLSISFSPQTINNSSITTTVQNINITETSSIYPSTPFTITNSFICFSSQPTINIGNNTILCPNTNITLKNLTSSIFDSFLWSTNETSSSIQVNTPGAYWLAATESCTGTILNDTIIVDVLHFPEPNNLIKDTILCLSNSIILDATHIGGTYQWNDGSISPFLTGTLPGLYFVDITYQSCVKRFYSNIVGCEEYIIPNVFTPNNDNYNDLFKIVYNGDQEYRLLIYNRWGQLMFESNEKEYLWNGKNAPDGTYFYIFSLGKQEMKGTLSLFR